jgi:histidinol-phosphate phosphatase family protein
VSTRAAVFLDRDGTIIHDREYLADPAQVQVIADAPESLARLSAAGLALIVITNQSGIGRGLFGEAEYQRVADRVNELLAAHGITITATYHCPDAPNVPMELSCRKPGDKMHLRAALEHGLDLKRSFYVGDKWRDVAPAVTHEATGILIPTPDTAFSDLARAKDDALVATTLTAAVDRILRTHAQRG